MPLYHSLQPRAPAEAMEVNPMNVAERMYAIVVIFSGLAPGAK